MSDAPHPVPLTAGPPSPPRRAGEKGIVVLLLVASAGALFVLFGPVDEALLDASRFASTTIVDRNGVVLYEPLSVEGGRGSNLDWSELPPLVVSAALAAEDRRFFSHPGVDPIAVVRAAVRNATSGRRVEGGSTITQQVAKLVRASGERSWRNKIGESVLAIRLERRLSKREILAMYLNAAPYGNSIHGIGRASRFYFGVAPRDLTPAQAAFLASLPQRPSAFNPLRDPDAARTRQLHVLAAMSLSPEQRSIARDERLRFDGAREHLIAQHFVERVMPSCRGARVCKTTLDAALQRDVAGIIAAHRPSLEKHGAKHVAVAVLHNRTGEWLAWEGSGDYFHAAIDGVTSPRQPGSTLKPFTYALAFERGVTPASIVADVKSSFATAEEGVVYSPRNYDGRYRGPLRVREALANSQNVPAVATLSQLGPESFLGFLRNAGFDGLDKTASYYGLGLTLGDAEVRLDQLVGAYAMFARGGVPVEPAMIAPAKTTEAKPLVSKRTAFWISDILSDDDAREFAFGEGGSLDFPFRVAVKTGTSQAYRDNWTLGFTRDVTVGVWVGNFDRAELRNSSGVTGAAPIFRAVMLAATKRVRGSLPLGDEEPIVPAEGVESVEICSASGARPSPWCASTQPEFLPADGSAEFCSWHRAGSSSWPAKYAEWAPKSASVTPAPDFRVTNPPDGATYLLDPTLRSEFQTLRFAATKRAKWFVGNREVKPEWTPRPGEHVVTAVDSTGRRDSVTIYVK